LDPNGEYFDSFNDLGSKKVRKFTIKLDESDTNFEQLKIPAWMWNSQEWISFSQAAPGAQRPLLLQSLLDLKRGKQLGNSNTIRVHSFLNTSRNSLLTFLGNLPTTATFAQFMGMVGVLQNISTDLDFHLPLIPTDNQPLSDSYNLLNTDFKQTLANREWQPGRFNSFSHQDISSVIKGIDAVLSHIQLNENETSQINPDTPIKFELNDLIPYLEQLAEN